MTFEHCCICDNFTGKAGRSDDSLYRDIIVELPKYPIGSEIGPLCESCFDYFVKEGNILEEF